MYFMYVDEAGSSGVRDKHRRYLALVGVAFDESVWLAIECAIDDLKLAFFDTTEIELHSYELRRRKKAFGALAKERYQELLKAITVLFQQLPITIFAVVEDVSQLVSSNILTTHYEVAYTRLLTQYDEFLQTKSAYGAMVLDSRTGWVSNKRGSQDNRIKYIHAAMRRTDNASLGPTRRVIGEVFFVSSKESFGIQLADLAAYPFFYRFEYDDPTYAPFNVLTKKLFR